MIDLRQSFESKFRVTPGCWLWTAKRHADGYGELWRNRKRILAHRIAYELYHGPIPEGLCVRHKCDNPRCVNPDHLEVGTHADNMRDKQERNRARYSVRRGVKNTQVKLTEADVLRIRADKRLGREIAAEYGITESSVSLIRNRKNWTHL